MCGIWCDRRCCTLLLYPSLYLGPRISNYASGLVELGGLEPPAPCLQNTCRLSATVAHLGLRPRRVGQDRFVSDPVVVRFGGQLRPCRPQAAGLTLTVSVNGRPTAPEAVGAHPPTCGDDSAQTRLVRVWSALGGPISHAPSSRAWHRSEPALGQVALGMQHLLTQCGS